MNGLNIAIVGAGIGGLTAAAALAEARNTVTVFDQFAAPKPVGSGLIIQPVGHAVLDLIGVADQVDALAAPLSRMKGYDEARSWPVLDVEYDPGELTGSRGLGIHRAALFQVLHDRAVGAGAKIVTNHEVVGINNYHTRKLRFADGRESEVYDLVIDAAGASSPISPLKARPLKFGAVWGTVDWVQGTDLPPDQLSQCYSGAEKMAGVLPIGLLPGNDTPKAAVFWSLKRDDHEGWRATPFPDCRDEITALWPASAPFFEQIKTHDAMTSAFYSHGTLGRMYAPGLAHIGDAAHSTSPQLGQGANMALLDAYALAMAIENFDNLRAALRAYGRIRSRHLMVYQTLSRLFTPLYQSDRRAVALLRDFMLAPLSRIPLFRRLLSRVVCGNLVEPLREGVLR